MTFEKQLKENKEFAAGLEILKTLNDAGHEAFFVGGCVRDLILGVEVNDVDIATNAPLEFVEESFGCHDIGNSKDFGIVVVNHKGFSFEVAEFRTEGEYTDGRRPDEVQATDSFEEDVKRRDFTMNALGLDAKGNVVDHVGGVEDLKAGVIRTVGNAFDRFEEDHLRILRAVRFANRFGFDFEPNTFAAVKTLRNKVDLVAKERVKDELFKMAKASGSKFADAVELLDRTRLLEVVLPEVKAMQDVQEEPRFHPEAYVDGGNGTTFDHTLAALRMNEVKCSLTNFAVLFHDLGKAETHQMIFHERTGTFRHGFHGHGKVGSDIADVVARRLKFSTEEREVVKFCANEHMTLLHCREMKMSKAAKFANHEFFSFLKQVMFCDDSCRLDQFDAAEFHERVAVIEKAGEDFKEFVNNKTVKVVDGKTVMEVTGLKPSPMVGVVINEVSQRFMDGGKFVCLRTLTEQVFNEMK